MNDNLNNNANNKSDAAATTNSLADLFKDEYAVILLQGKNGFGDMIYSYVKVTLPNIKRLYAALTSGEAFSPSDFGSVIAAGKGSPSDSLRKEMDDTYNMLQAIPPTVFPPAAKKASTVQKKAWDEY